MDRRNAPLIITVIVDHIAAALHNSDDILRSPVGIAYTLDIYGNAVILGEFELIQKSHTRCYDITPLPYAEDANP